MFQQKLQIQYLRTATGDDESKIKTFWNDTFDERKLKFSEKSYTIDKYFEEFKFLKQDFGSQLLCLDYEKMYPNSINNLAEIWRTVNEKLINFFKTIKQKDSYSELLKETNELTGFRLVATFLSKSVYRSSSAKDKKKKNKTFFLRGSRFLYDTS